MELSSYPVIDKSRGSSSSNAEGTEETASVPVDRLAVVFLTSSDTCGCCAPAYFLDGMVSNADIVVPSSLSDLSQQLRAMQPIPSLVVLVAHTGNTVDLETVAGMRTN